MNTQLSRTAYGTKQLLIAGAYGIGIFGPFLALVALFLTDHYIWAIVPGVITILQFAWYLGWASEQDWEGP